MFKPGDLVCFNQQQEGLEHLNLYEKKWGGNQKWIKYYHHDPPMIYLKNVDTDYYFLHKGKVYVGRCASKKDVDYFLQLWEGPND